MEKFKLKPLISALVAIGGSHFAQAQTAPTPPESAASAPLPAAAAASAPAAAPDLQKLDQITITGQSIGKGETRANSVVDRQTILQQPPGLDPLKVLARVPGLQVNSSDSVTGSFSMRLSMRGLNKEQIGVSIDGIPNGSTLSNGGSMPNRLMDPANLQRVDVSQSAGDIGTPSNQALGGYIDFKTRDPKRTAGGEGELALGNYNYRRIFARYDTGEMAPGLTAYVDASHSYVNTWPGEQSGRSRRNHIDLRALQEFEGGHSVRATLSLNDMSDNDYDAVALRAGSRFKAVFETDPTTDGLTDRWTGDPNIDQNNRRTRGIDSKEIFFHVDGTLKLGESTSLSVKPYLHRQLGAGWFYVPYKQLPVNGQVYSSVPDGINPATGRLYTPVATVQECYANQYQRTSSGALIPTSSVVFPTGVTAATLSAAGCPAAARFAMNPQSAWGDREASRRRGGYYTNRTGTLGELATRFGDHHDVRVGGWYEYIRRTKDRNWYLASDPKQGFDYRDSDLYSTTQDRLYRSHTLMGYAQDKIGLFDDRAQIDIGATYQYFSEVYRSPVEFSGERTLTVKSKLLPKVGALYRLNDDLEVFGSASKNFSAIPDSVFEGTAAIGAEGIKPETSTNKDLGIRYLGKTTALSFQVYSIDYRDRISIQNGNPDGDIFNRDAFTTFRNQGGIRSRGFEVTARAMLTKAIEVNANYAYSDARYTEDTPGECIKAGDQVLGVSRHNAFAELTWKVTDQWRVTGNAKHTGKAPGTFEGFPVTIAATATTPARISCTAIEREEMPEYTLLGASTSYKFGGAFSKTEISFNVENLLNKRYLGGVGAELATGNPSTTGRYFLGSPRTFYVAVRTSF
ncbi:MAG TPA: TonB-dependent receptor [Burkholderiaceae bacterium]|nr:TonB-dependent receptor [Burkholderiaceae bacterium]